MTRGALTGREDGAVYCVPDSGCLEAESAVARAFDGGTIDDAATALFELGPPCAAPGSTTPRSYFVEHVPPS